MSIMKDVKSTIGSTLSAVGGLTSTTASAVAVIAKETESAIAIAPKVITGSVKVIKEVPRLPVIAVEETLIESGTSPSEARDKCWGWTERPLEENLEAFTRSATKAVYNLLAEED